jgi:hypothetical protein
VATIPIDTRTNSTLRALRAITIVFATACAIVIAIAAPGLAQTGAEYPNTMPGPAGVPAAGAGSVVPPPPSGSGSMRTYENPAGDESAPPPTGSASAKTHHHVVKHHAKSSSADASAIEPAQGHLKLTEDSWAYERPSKSSKKIQPVQSGKFVNVIGTSRYYAQVKLKNSEIAYVPLAALQLVAPTDKMFKLTADASVLDEPNHAARKLAEVHQGRDVHVVGVALNYMKIRMKSGIEGYIPISALQ